MKKIKLLFGLLACLSLALTGCGEEMIELTEEEEAIITSYAAHLIVKYNKTSPEGYTYVYVPEETVSDDDAPEEDTTPEETVSGDDVTVADETSSDAVSGDDATEEENRGNSDSDEAAETEEEEVTENIDETMADALGIKGGRLVYTGVQFTSLYDTVYPEVGNKLMVLHFTIVNDKDSDLNVSILEKSPVFRASLNGASAATADISILTNDLSAYKGTIKKDSSEDVVLLFQIPKDSDETVESMKLQIRVGGNSTTVSLQ